MFAASPITGSPRVGLPVLAIVCEHDAEHFQEPAVRAVMTPAYPQLELVALANSGHYPMQETPVALATTIDRFLATARTTSTAARTR